MEDSEESAPATMPCIETPLSSQRSLSKSMFLIERDSPFTLSNCKCESVIFKKVRPLKLIDFSNALELSYRVLGEIA